jgi:hypothetical protein
MLTFFSEPRRTPRASFGRRLTGYHKKLSKPAHLKNLLSKQFYPLVKG